MARLEIWSYKFTNIIIIILVPEKQACKQRLIPNSVWSPHIMINSCRVSERAYNVSKSNCNIHLQNQFISTKYTNVETCTNNTPISYHTEKMCNKHIPIFLIKGWK